MSATQNNNDMDLDNNNNKDQDSVNNHNGNSELDSVNTVDDDDNNESVKSETMSDDDIEDYLETHAETDFDNLVTELYLQHTKQDNNTMKIVHQHRVLMGESDDSEEMSNDSETSRYEYESEENMTLPTQDEMIDWLKRRHEDEYKIGIQQLYKTTLIRLNENTTNPKVDLNKT